jgi:hypothetical protein
VAASETDTGNKQPRVCLRQPGIGGPESLGPFDGGSHGDSGRASAKEGRVSPGRGGEEMWT